MARTDTSASPDGSGWPLPPRRTGPCSMPVRGRPPSRPSGRRSAPGRWPSTSTSCRRSTASAWTTSQSTTASPTCSASSRRLPAPLLPAQLRPDVCRRLSYLLSFVQTSAGATADAREAERGSATDDGQWRAASAPLLARVFGENAYPTAARVGPRPVPPAAAPTTPATPTTSGSNASSTASPPSSTTALTLTRPAH